MKKKYLITLSLLATVGAHAHITPQKTDGSTAEGIIAPNLTRAQLISKDDRYTTALKGAIVYVTTVDGSVTPKTNKVTTIGYYYFDGSIWLPFGSGATVTVPTEPWLVQGGTTQATGNNQDIYQSGSVAVGSNTAGTYKFQVTGTSHVTENSRVGSSTVVGAQTVGSTLGVTGATTLANTLKVTGGTNLNSTLSVLGATTIASTGSFTLQGNGAGAGKYLASDASGKGTWTALPATATNAEPWQVQGGTSQATSNTQNIYQKGSVAIGAGLTSTSNLSDKSLYVNGVTLLQGDTQIGVKSASSNLVVQGNSTVSGNTTIGQAGAAGAPPTGNLKVYGMGNVGISNAVYPGTNYAMHVYGKGAIGGLWVENYANLKNKVSVGENLTAADDALVVAKGKTILNGATTIASTGSFTLQGNGAGAGKYLASDASGKGTWTALPATATNAEPWQVQGGTSQATSNTQNIYQKGSVAIGAGLTSTSNMSDKSLYVNGVTLLQGDTQIGVKSASSNLVVQGNSTVSGNTTIGQAGAAGAPPTGNLKVYGMGNIGTSNAVYAGTNYAMQVYGRGAVGGLWVENSTNLRRTTTIGAALPATTHALIVENGITTLKGAATITAAGSFTLQGNGAANGHVLSSDATGNATWKNQNMLSGSWFYLPSFNFDMSSLTPKTVNLFDLGTKQLLAASTSVGSSPGAAKPTLPTVATAYDYIVVGTSGHVTNISITAAGVMTYTPTTTNPPIDAYVNIIVRVK